MATLELHIVIKGRAAILEAMEGHIREYIAEVRFVEHEIAGGLVEKEGCDGEEKTDGVSDGK